MQQSKEFLLSILRNKETSRTLFRSTAHTMARLMALETLNHLTLTKKNIATPIETTTGLTCDKRIVIIPVLRSGITMLEAFLEIFPEAFVGVVGLRRDEKTAEACWYYENLPKISESDQIIIIDPMIATGGTGIETITLLKKHNANLNTLIFANIISAPEGITHIKRRFPEIKIITGTTDHKLNDKKFIVPGLGDFGDRYFGTEI